jgi:hypothetical protein
MRKIRTFTPLDGDTWDALATKASRVNGSWQVKMSNQSLSKVLGGNRRLASFRAKRLVEFGMVTPIYSELNGKPQAKVYIIDPKWLGRSPKVGDYYPVEVPEASKVSEPYVGGEV